MVMSLLKQVFGTRNDRILKSYRKVVASINALEVELESLSNDQLKAKTEEFKARLADGVSLNALLPEAFAVVREASKRVLGMRHFDVQCIGGMVMHHGKIAEMRTGEGKTLMATLAAYLNALTGRGVHIVTVNDYLVKRDANWMRPVYEALGLTLGINVSGMELEEKQAAYAADITYGTNNEFGFDYLRDNMVYDLSERVQRPLHYAIIDEVDSILIDEARTPLIISGQAEDASDLYAKINQIIPKLKRQNVEENPLDEVEIPEADRGDYTIDEKNKQVHLTDRGHQHVEMLLLEMGAIKSGESLYDFTNISLMHYVNAALRAHTLYARDVDYVVKNGEVFIVDEHTGRLMEGRRWSEGLHQAVEAKEGVEVQLENQTLATITFQNYFRLYDKLAGMTGTADTEAFELQKTYGLEVIVVPTNKPMIREDKADQVYLTQKEKFEAVVASIEDCRRRQQPVLVGTASIETSELLSRLLKQKKIKHEVLNAKQHEREAHIIAQAGCPGAVTIATNMAGRGTDIVLGGNLESELEALGDKISDEKRIAFEADWKKRHQTVCDAGGLHVLGSERHESRRIDNQLRGRAGRQGDPGSSQFYLSLEDNLLRIFAAERLSGFMRKLGIEEGEVIEHRMITRSIEKAQNRVESFHFDIRKQLLEFDDVANDQRKVVYQQRVELLESDSISDWVADIFDEAVEILMQKHVPPESVEEDWDVAGLERELHQDFSLDIPVRQWLEDDKSLHETTLRERIQRFVHEHYVAKCEKYGDTMMRDVEKTMLLQLLDHYWKDHLAAMDHLRQGIHLRGYAQKNPTQEFKRESFELFTQLWQHLKYEYISNLCRMEFVNEAQLDAQRSRSHAASQMNYHHADFHAAPMGEVSQGDELLSDLSEEPGTPYVRNAPKIGRNDPCHCGSGKKYKQCHGKLV